MQYSKLFFYCKMQTLQIDIKVTGKDPLNIPWDTLEMPMDACMFATISTSIFIYMKRVLT